ncbi:MAG: GNAT family N-acetyltransferase, partial [Vulcanisaeta sp.]
DVDYALSMTREVYISNKGVGFDVGFSVGKPTSPVRMEMLATEHGDFEEYFGMYIVYELAL